jgi:hypothetical protein
MSKKTQDIKHQFDAFTAATKELGCDEDPAHFDEALKKVARHKALPEASAPPKPQRQKKPSQ